MTIPSIRTNADGNGTRGYMADGFNGFSKTMECANDDWNVSQLAAQLGQNR